MEILVLWIPTSWKASLAQKKLKLKLRCAATEITDSCSIKNLWIHAVKNISGWKIKHSSVWFGDKSADCQTSFSPLLSFRRSADYINMSFLLWMMSMMCWMQNGRNIWRRRKSRSTHRTKWQNERGLKLFTYYFKKVHVFLTDTWLCPDGKICTQRWQTTSTSLISRRTDWTIWWRSWSHCAFTTNVLLQLQPAIRRQQVQGTKLLEGNLKTRVRRWGKSRLVLLRFCSYWQFGQWAWEFKEGATGVQAGLHTTKDQFQTSKYYFYFSA